MGGPKLSLSLLLLTLTLSANKVDSLEQLLASAQTDSNKVQLYFQLYSEVLYSQPKAAEYYINEAYKLSDSLDYKRGLVLCFDKLGGLAMVNSQFSEATLYFQKADQLLQDMDWPREQAVIYGNFAAIYEDLGEFDSALVWNDRFLDIARSIDNKMFEAFGMTVAGDIFQNKGQHELAGRNYLKAVRIYETLNEPARLADVLRLLGATQTSFLNFEDARTNLKKAIAIYLQINDQYYLAQSYRNLAHVYYLKETFPQAITYNRKALDIAQQLEDPFGIAQAYENLGEIFNSSDTLDQALDYLQKSDQLYLQIADSISSAGIKNLLAEVHYKLGNLTRALGYNQIAEAVYTNFEIPAGLKNVYLTSHKIYQSLGEDQQALNAFQKYTEIKDSLFTVEKASRLEELQLIYKVEKKDQEIELLSKDLALENLKRRTLWISLLSLALIAGLVIINQVNHRKKERKIAKERQLRQEAELEKSKLAKEQLERELAAQALQLCRKNELLITVQQEMNNFSAPSKHSDDDSFRKLERTIQYNLQSDDDWGQFLATFKQVHPEFLKKLQQNSETLSPSEQRLACLYKMNLSSKEIATMLNISGEGIKKARYRLRKKLNLNSSTNLQQFLINFPSSQSE